MGEGLAVVGLIVTLVGALLAFASTLRGSRSDDIARQWAEIRARGDDIRQLRTDVDTERKLRQAAEDRLRTELEASERRCDDNLRALDEKCQAEKHDLELRITALGGA